MDPIDPHVPHWASTEPLERDLAEVDAAIELVRNGAAVRVRLVGLGAVERVARVAAARAQAARIDVEFDRTGLPPSLTIGPRHWPEPSVRPTRRAVRPSLVSRWRA
jgi:hypothetical protein